MLTDDTLHLLIDCRVAIDWEAYYNGMGVMMPNGAVLKHEPLNDDEFVLSFHG